MNNLLNRLPVDENKIVAIVNMTFDDLRNWDDSAGREAKAAFAGAIPDEVYDKIPGEGAFAEHNGGDLLVGGIAAIDGEPHLAIYVEFHYRNDATRRKWGTPVTLETHIPLPEVVTPLAIQAYERACEKNERVRLLFNEWQQPDGTSTDDRHVLMLYFPLDSLVSREETEQRAIRAIS